MTSAGRRAVRPFVGSHLRPQRAGAEIILKTILFLAETKTITPPSASASVVSDTFGAEGRPDADGRHGKRDERDHGASWMWAEAPLVWG